MNTFAFDLNLTHRLFEPETATSLAEALSSFLGAGDEQVVAFRLGYLDTEYGPLRFKEPGFVVRCGNQIGILSYDDLSPPVRVQVADAVVRLEKDREFSLHLWCFAEAMKDGDDLNPHEVLVTPDAVSFFRPDVARRQRCEWSEEKLDRFYRVVCRQAATQKEAIARHDDLKALVLLWWLYVESIGSSQTHPLPSLRAPTVGDLLP